MATHLMIEPCGARLARARSTSGAPARSRRPSASVTTESTRPARGRDSPGALGRSSRALEFKTAPADDGLDVTARLPPGRRQPGGRRDRGGGPALRAGEAARDAALPPRRLGRLTPRQRQRRRAADVLVAQGLSEVVGWSFNGPDTAGGSGSGPSSPSSSWRTRCRSSNRGCAAPCWARCSMWPRSTCPVEPPRCGCLRPGPCFCPSRVSGCPPSPTTWRRCCPGQSHRHLARGQPREGRLLRDQGSA